jgi:hypothetical protein
MMNTVDLIRIEQSDDGTFGVLKIDGQAWCVTLEPPRGGNAKNISCIPSGRYVCRRIRSPRFGLTFEVTNVPGRTHILLHPGNVVADTQGCVLLGRHFGLLRGDRGVLKSGRTFQAFMDELDGVDEFLFIVEDLFREAA